MFGGLLRRRWLIMVGACLPRACRVVDNVCRFSRMHRPSGWIMFGACLPRACRVDNVLARACRVPAEWLDNVCRFSRMRNEGLDNVCRFSRMHRPSGWICLARGWIMFGAWWDYYLSAWARGWIMFWAWLDNVGGVVGAWSDICSVEWRFSQHGGGRLLPRLVWSDMSNFWWSFTADFVVVGYL